MNWGELLIILAITAFVVAMLCLWLIDPRE